MQTKSFIGKDAAGTQYKVTCTRNHVVPGKWGVWKCYTEDGRSVTPTPDAAKDQFTIIDVENIQLTSTAPNPLP